MAMLPSDTAISLGGLFSRMRLSARYRKRHDGSPDSQASQRPGRGRSSVGWPPFDVTNRHNVTTPHRDRSAVNEPLSRTLPRYPPMLVRSEGEHSVVV